MDKVNEIVLESAVVILGGGVDKDGTPIVTFPVDSADLLDIYSCKDILRLMQAFSDLSGGQVTVVADLQEGWTEAITDKLTYLLNELQDTRKRCIKKAYFVKPFGKTTKRLLIRNNSNTRENRKIIPLYDTEYLNHVRDLYEFIDKSQLSTDYGGTMQYNHIAWVDFQRTYIPIITAGREALVALAYIRNEINRLKYLPVTKSSQISQGKEGYKYQNLISQYKVRETIKSCEDAIERLEHPECDPNLMQTHAAVLHDTTNKLKEIHFKITTELATMDAVMMRSDAEHALIVKLEECEDHTTEVEETIELMLQRVQGLPWVGTNVEEAKSYRDKFVESVLTPSKDIVSCASSILQDLECGKNTTQTTYAMSINIAKRLTEGLQPFTKHLNEINEAYIRIHLFHVISDKIERWKQKATLFLTKLTLQEQKDRSNNSSTNENIEVLDENENKLKRSSDLHLDLDKLLLPDKNDTPNKCNRIAAPKNWQILLTTFYKKHPPPEKKHVRLLNKFVPKYIQERQKLEAEVLAERVLFILQMLNRNEFKPEDIQLIQTWSYKSKTSHLDSSRDMVTLV